MNLQLYTYIAYDYKKIHTYKYLKIKLKYSNYVH